MFSRVLQFELEGQTVIGFDTGLDNKAFAQAKMAQFLSQNGYIVKSNGSIKPWKAEGVYELPRHDSSANKTTMVMWGPDFSGLSLDKLVQDSNNREQALEAVRFYIKAMSALLDREKSSLTIFPGTSGAIFCNQGSDFGSFFFPPERLVKRSIEADGEAGLNKSQQWYHPDLKGEQAAVYTTAVMLYTIFASALPFEKKDIDTLRHDIREGVYMPIELAAPGFDKELGGLISDAINPGKNNKRPSLLQIINCLEKSRSHKIADFFTELAEEERQKIKNKFLQYKKNQDFNVRTKRFVIRNTAIITACLALVLTVVLFTHGYFRRLSERFNTIGLSPIEVAQAYYNAFNSLDHDIIDACIHGRNARNDITLVMNLFVISRARQAYEMDARTFIPAQDWIDSGSPETNALIFGVTDLMLQTLSVTENEVFIQADYNLWIPPGYLGETENFESYDTTIISAVNIETIDILTFALINDAWRIIEIERSVDGMIY